MYVLFGGFEVMYTFRYARVFVYLHLVSFHGSSPVSQVLLIGEFKRRLTMILILITMNMTTTMTMIIILLIITTMLAISSSGDNDTNTDNYTYYPPPRRRIQLGNLFSQFRNPNHTQIYSCVVYLSRSRIVKDSSLGVE